MRKTGKTSTVKISRPKVSGIAPRQRLFRLLDSSKKKPIIWITGPAGSGKTTLAASWLDARKLPCLWYQVDEGDGDIATFFYYMGLAAKKAAPRYKRHLPLLTPEYLLGVPTFTRRYFEELFRRLKEPFIVVLDNFQDAASPALREMISHALETIPEGVNVVLLSRSEPPAELSRLRANDKMALVGWNELSFTYRECRAFLRTKRGKTFSAEAVKQIHKKTDGWVAGLVLMTEMAKAKEIRYSLISELSREAVFNYFASEIFEKADSDTRDFLLKTSFFPSMSLTAAEELTGNAGAGKLLSTLSRNHYFTDWRSLSSPVYQYHPLFREFLQSRAGEVYSRDELIAIQRSTAVILEKEGRTDEAALLFIGAGDHEALAGLILGQAQSLVDQGRHKTLEEWLHTLPDNIVDKRPWLVYWLGMCSMPFDPAESRGSLEKAFEGFNSGSDAAGMFLSWAGIAETFMYELGDFSLADRWISEIQILLSRYPQFPSPEIKARVTYAVFCVLMFRQPYHPDLPRWEEKLKKIALHSTDHRIMVIISAQLVLYYTWWTGDQAKAAMLIDTIGPAVTPAKIDPLTHIVWRAFEAAHYWMTANEEACISSVKKGLQTAKTSGIHIWDFVLLAQATWAITGSSRESIASHLRSMEFVTTTNRRIDIFYYHYLLGWEALCLGNPVRAEEHMTTALNLVKETGIAAPFGVAFTLMGLGEVLIESGKYEKAEYYLDDARRLGLKMKSKTVEYHYSWLHSLLCLKRGKDKSAMDDIRLHLAISREYGILNHPCWRSSVMVRLYEKALEAGIEVSHVQHLIRKHKLVPDAPMSVDEWPYPVKIYTLGDFGLLKNDEPVQFGNKVQQKPLAMLKTLTALGGRDIAETQMTDILWPDADGDSAHKSFEMTLLRLRRLLGREDAVSLKGGSLSLNAGCCRVDAQAFENLARNADEMWKKSSGRESRDRAAGAVRLSEKALEMYKGPFLPNDTDMDCTVAMREKMRNLALQQVAFLGSHWVKARQWQKAIESYRNGIEIDGLFEDFYRCLMACHEKLGQRAEAVRVYQSCQAALSSELGIEPSEKTKVIYSKIRSKA